MSLSFRERKVTKGKPDFTFAIGQVRWIARGAFHLTGDKFLARSLVNRADSPTERAQDYRLQLTVR